MFYFNEDGVVSEEHKRELRDHKVKMLGMYVDIEEKYVMLLLVSNNYMNYIQSMVNREGRGYKVYFRNFDNNTTYETKTYLDSSKINIIQEMYIQYFKNKK